MGRYSGRRTYWCMDCNLYPVTGPNEQCAECSGVELDWGTHVAPLLSTPDWDPRPLTPVKAAPARRTPHHPIPRSANEVTYHPRVSVTP